MNEKALMVIISALGECEEIPGKDWTRNEVEEVTLFRWAIEEILDLVWDHPWILASETISTFAIKMEVYKETSKTANQKWIFSIAAAIAWKLLEAVEEAER